MTLITEVEEHAGRPGHTPSVWLLLPTANQGLPVIDGVAVPIVNNIQNTRASGAAAGLGGEQTPRKRRHVDPRRQRTPQQEEPAQ